VPPQRLLCLEAGSRRLVGMPMKSHGREDQASPSIP
jgi:hypothetical protein